jgi:beta-lactam-binding protein with PASTA domain
LRSIKIRKMAFFSFLTKKKFYLHFGISIVILIIIFLAIFQFLKIYTGHADEYEVPDFYGMTLEEIEERDDEGLFEYVIIDSLYDARNKKETVVIQHPRPGSSVKKGRKIYFTIVAKMPEMVEMPDLIDLSLRQAINLLNARGLYVNKLEYVSDFAENAVLEQLYQDDIIEQGTQLEKGSGIDLVLGLGDNTRVPVPFLIGLNYQEAVDAINRASFNVGNVHYMDGNDRLHSKVYQQRPDWSEDTRLYRGQKINIRLRSDEFFDFEALIQKYKPDTTSVDTSVFFK